MSQKTPAARHHGTMKIRFAVSAGLGAPDIDRFAADVGDLEALGFDTVWLSDVPLGATLDPIVGLSYAAAVTTTLKLGANIVPIGRNPLTLAKSLAQIDQLSRGRLLLSFVVGLDQPGERQALGASGANRGRLLEEVTPLLRTWWAGDSVDHGSEGARYHFDAVPSPGEAYQKPLEVWFGGSGTAALTRTGRLADGWLGSAMSPPEAQVARERIERAAAESGRTVDPEHFGLSIPYAATEPDERALAFIRSRRPDADLDDLFPVGPDHLRRLVTRHVDAGLSKFVIRPTDLDGDRHAALGELADLLLPLQT
jgi:probable F420-dependent oxidoreductase